MLRETINFTLHGKLFEIEPFPKSLMRRWTSPEFFRSSTSTFDPLCLMRCGALPAKLGTEESPTSGRQNTFALQPFEFDLHSLTFAPNRLCTSFSCPQRTQIFQF